MTLYRLENGFHYIGNGLRIYLDENKTFYCEDGLNDLTFFIERHKPKYNVGVILGIEHKAFDGTDGECHGVILHENINKNELSSLIRKFKEELLLGENPYNKWIMEEIIEKVKNDFFDYWIFVMEDQRPLF